MRRWWWCAVFCCFSVVAQPDDSAQAWMDKMASALKQLNYQVSFVLVQPNGGFEPYLWRHAVQNGIEVEHLSLQNGPGREIVRIGDLVSYFEPNVPAYSIRSTSINGPLPVTLFRQPKLLEESYDFVVVGRSRVAGRSAQQIRIISKDRSRYGYNLWLDQDSGLLLKLDMMNLQGEPLEQVQVTSLHVTPEPDEYFLRIEEDKMPETLHLNEVDPVPGNWKVNWLPVGMVEVRRDMHRLPMTGQMVDYVMFSDGLIDVSLYLQAVQPGSSENGWLKYGANTLLSLQKGALEITVVGKLPPQTANAIANSVQYIETPQ